MTPDLDRLFLQGKLSEDEYCALAMEDGQVVAVAIDEIDRITTVSLSLTPKGYLGEVLYSPESLHADEKFLSAERSFQQAKTAFTKRVAQLQSIGKHSFDVTWFKK
jgi:hypothetical protein